MGSGTLPNTNITVHHKRNLKPPCRKGPRYNWVISSAGGTHSPSALAKCRKCKCSACNDSNCLPFTLYRMRVLLAFATLVVVARAASVFLEDLDFHNWKLKFGKSYGSEEEESQRKMIWLDNLKLVLEHNKLADQGNKSYRLGMNKFADMTNKEFQAMFTGCMGFFNNTKTQSKNPFLEQAKGNLPKTVDWKKKGYVTPVKDQMQCGSCWAYGVTGSLEGQIFRKTKLLVSLSEQQLVDCSRNFGNGGCQGGWPHRAFEYIIFNEGLEAEATYPYEGNDGPCRYKPQNAITTCRGFNFIFHGDEKCLQTAVAKVGPISIAIDASRSTFQLYQSGVYDDPDCRTDNLNHAVLAVGYGSADNKQDYWLVKNSGINSPLGGPHGKANERKQLKYHKLVEDNRRKGWKARCEPIE
ncbi:hypothetical protein NFI96_034278, partial [Prochilodus magdalenae]